MSNISAISDSRREMARGAKAELSRWLQGFGFNALVTCHFPKAALWGPDKGAQCIRGTEAFYRRLNRAAFRSTKLRLSHFTVFEDQSRYGSSTDLHMHALWRVEECWRERIQERYQREWNKIHQAHGLDCDWRPIDFAPGAIKYVLKHVHSDFEILASLPD